MLNCNTSPIVVCTQLKLNLLFQGDLVSVKNLVIQCIKYHFQPWKCRTFFNPEAEDTLSIKKKREPHEILILTLKALVCTLDILFLSNHNIHKSSCCLCTSDTKATRTFMNVVIGRKSYYQMYSYLTIFKTTCQIIILLYSPKLNFRFPVQTLSWTQQI